MKTALALLLAVNVSAYFCTATLHEIVDDFHTALDWQGAQRIGSIVSFGLRRKLAEVQNYKANLLGSILRRTKVR